jgi:1,4-dihydroxy-2-naphthoate octaprenyltransferase
MAMTTTTKEEARPSTLHIWWTAARPHTLTASLSPCLVAYALCQPPAHLQAAWTLFCMTVQIGTNLHNDYSDYVQGADTDKRVGHARATAKGWLTPTQTCVAATGTLAVTLACGIYLGMVTRQTENAFFWFWILSSIFNAFAYTGGPYPLGYLGLGQWSIAYAGLGEVFVLLYFGYVAVLMLPYLVDGVQAGDDFTPTFVNWPEVIVYATAVGLLSTNIILVNNLRDHLTDVLVDKRTTTVRFGRSFGLGAYVFCLVLALLQVLVIYVFLEPSPWRLLPLAVTPLAVHEARAVFRKEGPALNQHVGGAAKVEFFFCILVAVSKWMAP